MYDRQEIIRKVCTDDEDKILIASVLDKLETCRDKNYMVYTRFLDMRQRSLVKNSILLAGAQNECVFFGGYKDAERVCAIFYPYYLNSDDAILQSPISLLRIDKQPQDKLSHRDYLGSLMGLQIQRDRIGDILVTETGAELIVLDEIADFILLNLVQAGRKHISVSKVPLNSLRMPVLSEITGTGSVASLRIDAVISLVFSLSRSNAQSYIEKGLVFVNQQPCLKSGKEICVNDTITIRGKGRCKITDLGGTSRKGRQFINFVRTSP